MAEYGKKPATKVEKALLERKAETSGSGMFGKKVKSRTEAIAIGVSASGAVSGKVQDKSPTKRSTAKKSSQ